MGEVECGDLRSSANLYLRRQQSVESIVGEVLDLGDPKAPALPKITQ